MTNDYTFKNDFNHSNMPFSQPKPSPFASPKHKRSGSIDFDYSRRASSGGESTYSLYTRNSVATPPDSPRVSKMRPIDLDKVTQASDEFQRKLSLTDPCSTGTNKISEDEEDPIKKRHSSPEPDQQYFARDFFDLKEFLRCNPDKDLRANAFESTYLPESSLETIGRYSNPDTPDPTGKKTVVTKAKLTFRGWEVGSLNMQWMDVADI